VSRDQLLLLTQRVDESERMRAESHDRDDRQGQECSNCTCSHAHSLTPVCRREHYEREHQPSRGLHAHADYEHGSRCAEIGDAAGPETLIPPRKVAARWSCLRHPRREHEGARQHEQHERVVVRTPRRQLEQHRIEADEHGRELR
jgi:hypothetical protein